MAGDPYGRDFPYKEVHKHVGNNRAEIEASRLAACLFCGAVYPAYLVIDYTCPKLNNHEDAICPKCSVDTVLGDAAGYPFDRGWMEKIYQAWFGV